MTTINRRQNRPSQEEIEQMFRELEVIPSPLDQPAIIQLLQKFREIYANGGAEFARFQLSNHPVFDWFSSHNRLKEINFFDQCITRTAVREALPSLEIETSLKSSLNLKDDSSAFTFDGELAKVLFKGGAYNKFKGSAKEAKTLGGNFSAALFGDRYDEVKIYVSYEPWSNWFGAVAWDMTWLGIDKGNNQLWLLSVTDTD
ncbi:hypothetical protein [Gloeothece verrucosa]|uniref:Group-specific protein n=1 Tax=Gloeothece verrucosa (strain PCC 7822) TaxID=497965 RepID=E0UCK1_GLOV7|nr:hypothetical protein [Gloeothece verrucosa]ADN14072.1 group-specific protein [Gloeothece verrucosa PCC 7822]